VHKNITAPILAVYANPKEPGPYAYNVPNERVEVEDLQEAGIEAFMKAIEAKSLQRT
jgi:hypothetical protein